MSQLPRIYKKTEKFQEVDGDEIEATAKIKAVQSIALCCICIASLTNGSQTFTTECVHTFHEDCLSQWVTGENNRYKTETKCPLCRRRINFLPPLSRGSNNVSEQQPHRQRS